DRKFPLPAEKNPADTNDTEFSTEPFLVVTNSLVCDYEQVKDFLPLGKTAHLSMPCQSVVAQTGARSGGPKPHSTEEAVSVELSDDGAAHLSLPSGNWEVRKVALKLVPKDSVHPTTDAELDIAPALGVSVKSHSAINGLPSQISTVTDSELVAYKP
ncbi:MAG: hypothetical protein JO258_17655, partial [Alphaproteobacteria bacterium]|nr:hypothetical protein [Alphaproteobacteria bacterium]